MNVVELKLFGDVEVVCGGAVLRRLPSLPCRRLIASLGLRGSRIVRKRALEELIWPGQEPPPNRLSVTLYQLRRSLQSFHPAAGGMIEASRTHLRLAPGLVQVDVASFQQGCEAAFASGSLSDLLSCLAWCRGPLLENWDEPWAVEAREHHRRLILKASSLAMKKAKSREEVGLVVQTLAKILSGDRSLGPGLVGAVRELEGSGSRQAASLFAEQLADQIVICSNPHLEESLRDLQEELAAQADSLEAASCFWCLVLLDHVPGSEVQNAIVATGGTKGRTPDYWLAESPQGALQIAKKILYVRPASRILLSLTYMDPASPLPLGLRSAKQAMTEAGLWVDLKAARAYDSMSLRLSGDDPPSLVASVSVT